MLVQTASFAAYVNASKTKKYGNHFWPRYMSPIKGKLVRVPKKLTGELPTREAAEDWIAKNIQNIIAKELKTLARKEWTKNATILKNFMDFSAIRKSEIPKSANQDLSMLKNFGIPYFLQEAGECNPNVWWMLARQFKAWLKTEATSSKGEKISISTANATINSVNHFLKWMRDEQIIEWSNFRPFEAFPASWKSERTIDELVLDG